MDRIFIPEFGYHIVSHADLSSLQNEPFKSHRRLKVFAQKGCKCVSCGVEGTMLAQGVRKDGTTSWDVYTDTYHPLTVDHIVPKSKGGKAHIDNLQPMCFSCNQLKANHLQPINLKLA